MICVRNAEMGVIHLSSQWSTFTGIAVADSLGRAWLRAVHAEDRPTVEQVLERAVEQKRGYAMVYRLLARDGRPTWVSDDAVASFAPEDRRFIGVIGSITEIPPGRVARASLGLFDPPPSMPSTQPTECQEVMADHILLARALADREGDRAIAEALDFALFLIRRRFGSPLQ